MAAKPTRKARKTEKAAFQSAENARATILRLAKRAETGDQQAVEFLHGWLERFPDLRALVRELDELAIKVERCWVRRFGAADELLSREAVEADLNRTRAELLGPSPTVVERMLASTVLIAHLAYQSAALAAAQAAQPEVRAARERLLSGAQKRLQDAVKGWATYTASVARGTGARRKLRLFDAAG